MCSAFKMMKNDLEKYLKTLAESTDNAQRRISLVCGVAPPSGQVKISKQASDVISLLDQFQDCAGYSKNRRGASILDLSSESTVQDLLYFMLRPSIPDLVPEQPIAGKTRQYSIQDFRSKALRIVIECKLVRDKNHGRSLKSELHDDIGEYKNDPLCDDLIFFIYDPDSFIESPSGLINSTQGTHIHNDRGLRVHCLIKN